LVLSEKMLSTGSEPSRCGRKKSRGTTGDAIFFWKMAVETYLCKR